jgi:hypothetical protein
VGGNNEKRRTAKDFPRGAISGLGIGENSGYSEIIIVVTA